MTIVFPVEFHGQYSLHMIFSDIVVDALGFKILMALL